MAKLWRRPRGNEDKKLHVHDVDLTRLRIDKPSVIFLNGFFTTDDSHKWVNASLRNMEELLKSGSGPKIEAEVYAWSHSGPKYFFNVAAYNMAPNGRACRAVRKLAAGLIMPLVANDFVLGEDGRASGTPLPLGEAKKNLRNITFFGYSAGCVTAQECFNASLQMMKQVGYSEKDARGVLNEAVYIGVGSMSRPSQEKDRFTTLVLEATNDRIVRFKNRIAEPLRALFNRFAPRLKIRPLSSTSAVITAAVAKKNWETRVRDGKTFRQKITSLLPRWTMVDSFHELPRYVTEDEELSPFAKMVRYALTNAVNRQRLLPPLDLLDPPPGIDFKISSAYREKIAKAQVKPPRR